MLLLKTALPVVPETSPTTKKKQKMKGKTLALTDFLSDDKGNVAGPGTSYVLAPKQIDWAAEMEKEETDDFADLDFGGSGKPKFDRTKLPTAPKAARGADIDPSRIPSEPPYTAFIGNLPYEADEDGIKHFFRNQKVDNVRLPMENGRLRGFGYVEFVDRQSLIDGIAMNDMMMSGRKIRVDLADQHQQQGGDRDRDRGDFGRDSGRDDRTESDWRRREPLADSRDSNYDRDDRYGGDRYNDRKGGYGDRDRYGGRDGGYSSRGFEDRGPRDGGRYDDRGSYGGGGRYSEHDSRDNRSEDRGLRDRGFDRPDGSRGGFDNFERDRGHDRLHDDRGGFRDRGYDRDQYGDRGQNDRGGYRDRGYDRQDRYGDRGGQRYNDRGFSNRDRYDDGGGRRGFGSGYRDGDRDRFNKDYDNERPPGRENSQELPSTRPRLNLKPRTKPVETSNAPDSRSSIFGSAKPVDTATKERLIEERLARERDDEKRKMEEEKENRNIGTGSTRSRRDSDQSQDGSNRRERRHSSGSSGKGVRPVPPPVTSQRSRRDSDLSNHSDAVFSGGEEPKDECKVPLSPSPRDDPSVKMVPAPPPRENIWEKRKSEHKLSTSPQSGEKSNSKSETSPVTSSASITSKVSHHSPPTPESNVWSRRQQERESQAKHREPGQSSRGRGGMGRGRGGGDRGRRRPPKEIPKSVEEMPKYEEKSSKDWTDSNPFAGLEDEEGHDVDDDGGEWQTV